MMKVKVNELRIGNFVERYGVFEQVVNIFKDGSIHSSVHSVSPDLSFYKPIPINEIWLLAFGFENFGSFVIEYGNFRIDFDQGYFWISETQEINRESIKIKLQYVHQLQNLYFVLTGEELRLKIWPTKTQ